MKRNKKGLSPILVIVIIAVLVVAVVVLLSTRKGGWSGFEKTGTQQTTQNVPAIQNANDLNTTASELDNTDLNAVDKELNQLDSDALKF